MRRLGLKTQLLVAIAVLQVYSLGVGLATWIMSRAHSRLERSFHQELVILKELPQLKDLVRQLDQSAGDYLRTGSASGRARLSSTLSGIRRIQAKLSELAFADERSLLRDLDRQISSYLARQGRLLRRGARLQNPHDPGLELPTWLGVVADQDEATIGLYNRDAWLQVPIAPRGGAGIIGDGLNLPLLDLLDLPCRGSRYRLDGLEAELAGTESFEHFDGLRIRHRGGQPGHGVLKAGHHGMNPIDSGGQAERPHGPW